MSDDFFIGWADTPKPDRRFFLGAGLGLLAGTGAVAGAAAAFQNAPGPGTWNQGEIREWTGIATAEPYSMLRTKDLDGTPRTVILACLGKCAVSARIGALDGQAVTVKGSLIQRGPHAMIAVVDGMDWIRAAEIDIPDGLAFPEPEPLQQATLRGEILDTKCWFGAMRPSQGKVHKSCAALCIRGGLPPALFVKDIREQSALLILTDRGGRHSLDLLPYVADPLEMSGELRRAGDIFYFDTPISSFKRLDT